MQAKFGPSNSSFFHLILTNCQLLRTATVTYTTNIITASTAHTSTSASNQVQENLPVDTDEKVPEQSPSNSSTLLSRESIVSSLLRLSCSRGRHSGFLLRLHTWPSIITSNTTMHSIWVAHCSEHTAVCLVVRSIRSAKTAEPTGKPFAYEWPIVLNVLLSVCLFVRSIRWANWEAICCVDMGTQKSTVSITTHLTVLYYITTTTNVLEDNLYSRHHHLRTEGFCVSEVLQPACPCWWQLAHSD